MKQKLRDNLIKNQIGRNAKDSVLSPTSGSGSQNQGKKFITFNTNTVAGNARPGEKKLGSTNG